MMQIIGLSIGNGIILMNFIPKIFKSAKVSRSNTAKKKGFLTTGESHYSIADGMVGTANTSEF